VELDAVCSLRDLFQRSRSLTLLLLRSSSARNASFREDCETTDAVNLVTSAYDFRLFVGLTRGNV
jgi:hypothetical protein